MIADAVLAKLNSTSRVDPEDIIDLTTTFTDSQDGPPAA
jgi:hypothetical protein